MSDLRKNKKSATLVTLGLMILQICLILIGVFSWIDLGKAVCEMNCDVYKLNGGGIGVIAFSQFWISILALIGNIICWFVELFILIYFLLKKMITFWFATISFAGMLLMWHLFQIVISSDGIRYIPK
jgi:hypothetical protein